MGTISFRSDLSDSQDALMMSPDRRRLLIVGDSMTEGGDGDYTWRYRFWEWTRNQNLNVIFTGPFTGTREADEHRPPQPPHGPNESDPTHETQHNGRYARDVSDDFDSYHFSDWGKQCLQGSQQIKGVLEAHDADILLVMLGFNDLGWFVSDAHGTLKSMKRFVDEARRANPRIEFVIANIPQRTYMHGRDDLPRNTSEYNELLAKHVPQWATKQSPIHIAELCRRYTAETASYDGLHPNRLGDYQIAQSFAEAFTQKLKLGRDELHIPKTIPALNLPAPASCRLASSPFGVSATWQMVLGCRAYEIRIRTNEGDFATSVIGSNGWDSHWATDGDVYEVQVRACYGDVRGAWTQKLSATARPQLAPPPANVRFKSGKGILSITFDRPDTEKAVHRYIVYYKDKAHPEWFPTLYSFKNSPAVLEMESGHVYDVWMSSWTVAEGFWGQTHEVTIE